MKIKQITAGITICILAFIMITLIQIQKSSEGSIPDMVWYNGEIKTIEDKVEQEITREAIEQEHGCKVLFLSDADYQSRLNESLVNDGIILDLYIKEQPHYNRDGFESEAAEGVFIGKVIWNAKEERYHILRSRLQQEVIIFGVIFLIITYGLLLILYRNYILPFRVLQKFTDQVAKGNLELALPIRRNNFFGAFTESFDLMREELKRARESEYRANISKKELIAELSHDIKTPVATIKATCEVLQVTEENEDTLRKVGVIAGKAEMIEQLVDNMFHATMEELVLLKVEPTAESSLMIPEMFHDFKYYGQITLDNEMPECLLYIDKLRLQQVLDNIINNSYKYAGTEVRVSFIENVEGIIIRIKDYGKGVAEEELALLKEKFYRGSNAEGKSGSGLGLYLVDNFMKQMNGGMECYCDDGFAVELFLKKV
ncbi:MAG: HAMP domain-containing histidine kinase [Lachnospiraceae bacterium]|nr:HAMP domain-containing histidine kinase [Lachnospiraceae bacterium]